jgi:Cop9 signalosome subunit 5 C-terminal domain
VLHGEGQACVVLSLDGHRFNTGKGKGNELQKVVKDCSKLAEEQLKGLTNQTVKNALFNRPLLQAAEQAPPA